MFSEFNSTWDERRTLFMLATIQTKIAYTRNMVTVIMKLELKCMGIGDIFIVLSNNQGK